MQAEDSRRFTSEFLSEAKYSRGVDEFSLREITIKEIKGGNLDDSFWIVNGKKTTNVRIVGYVKECTSANKFHVLTLCDLSGVFIGRVWDELVRETLPKAGDWVDVIGLLRVNQSNKGEVISMNITHIKPISDFNVFLFHVVKCVEDHLHYKNEDNPENAKKKAIKQDESLFNNNEEELNGIQQEVLEIYKKEDTGPNGVNKKIIFEKLEGKYAKSELDEAVTWLHEEGRIFGTIDEFHHRFCP